jgi:hypothetical protein
MIVQQPLDAGGFAHDAYCMKTTLPWFWQIKGVTPPPLGCLASAGAFVAAHSIAAVTNAANRIANLRKRENWIVTACLHCLEVRRPAGLPGGRYAHNGQSGSMTATLFDCQW